MKALRWLFAVLLIPSSIGCLGALLPKEALLEETARYSELETHMEGQVTDLSSAGTQKLWYLCTAYSKLKEYNKLFSCLDQLERNIEKGDRTFNNGIITFDMYPEPYRLRAEAYIDFGNYAAAVEQATKAYDIIQKGNQTHLWTRQSPLPVDILVRIQVLSTLALSYALNGDGARAQEYARLLDEVSIAWDFSVFKTDKLNGLAKTYMALGDFQRSLAIIKEDEGLGWVRGSFRILGVAIGVLGPQDNPFAFAQLPKLFILNKSLYETGQVKEAKEGYDKLLAMPQTKDNGDIYWLILFDRGKIAESEGNLKEAIDFYQKAIDVIEQQRSTINTEASKIGFAGNKQQVYHKLIRALFAGGQQARAFEYVERSKSRALVDLLASKKDFAAPGTNPQQVASLLNDLDTQEAEARVQKAESVRGSRAAEVKQRLQSVSPELASLVTVTPVAAAQSLSQIQLKVGGG